jgi:hypothetical protein
MAARHSTEFLIGVNLRVLNIRLSVHFEYLALSRILIVE